MQILLNDEELDVQFENEKLLAEVLRGIANWMESDAYYLREFILDGKHYTVQERPTGEWDFDLFQQELSQIDRLEIFSAPMPAYIGSDPVSLVSESENTILESLKTLFDYFRVAQNAFEKRQFTFLQDLFSDSEPLLELLQRSTSRAEASLRSAADQRHLHRLEYSKPLIGELKANLELWNYFQESPTRHWNQDPSGKKRDRMMAILQDLSIWLQEHYENYGAWLLRPARQLDNKENIAIELAQSGSFCDLSIAEIQAQVSQKSQELEEAVVQMQNGQVQPIFYRVSELSLLLEQLIQQNKVRGNQKLAALFTQMEPFLQELTHAIEYMDTVNIGDLVEYELIPLIQQIIDELAKMA